jgi:hypothetical protein
MIVEIEIPGNPGMSLKTQLSNATCGRRIFGTTRFDGVGLMESSVDPLMSANGWEPALFFPTDSQGKLIRE